MRHHAWPRSSSLALVVLAAACSDGATAPDGRLAALERSIVPSASISALAATVHLTEVVASAQGLRADGSPVVAERSDPTNALGAPDAVYFSLGFGGSLTAKFAEPFSGSLMLVVEQTETSYPAEYADVYVSEDGVDYVLVGQASNLGNPGEPQHETSLTLPAGCWQYVRIVDRSDATLFEPTADGFDVNAIAITDATACSTADPAGCSTGYYSQHDVPGDEATFDGFSITNTGHPTTYTLEDALDSPGGGPTLQAAKNLLLHQAAAALLNSALVDGFPMSTAEIVDAVNTALASADRGTILTLKAELDALNNLGCALGNAYPTE